jgi:thiosulfate/3-mercaptopyruvate sulfurtransferase
MALQSAVKRSSSGRQGPWPKVASTARPDPGPDRQEVTMMTRSNPALVDADWLTERLADPSVAIVEVDEDTTAYAAGHIPGAIAIDWKAELHAPPRRDFVDGVALARLLGEKGIDTDTTIVLYGGNSNWFAAYAYWLFKLRGVERVRLLDGGRKKWELDGRQLSTDIPLRRSTTFAIGKPSPDLRISRYDVLALVRAGDGRFVDVRSPEEFSGAKLAPPHLPQEQPYVGGHVPGARNIPWSRAANEDGTFRPADELRALYAAEGITANGPIVTYCRIGERSSHTWFVLHELLGLPNVRNYDGSWTEYGSLVDVPVET